MSLTILIVEDDALMRQSLEKMLAEPARRVVTAGSGREALAIARNRRCDLVLLDVRLPDANGIDILAELRESEEHSIVIVLTAYPDVQTAVAAMKAGAYDYIVKPFDPQELKYAIERALNTLELKSEVLRLRHEFPKHARTRELVGTSPATVRLQTLVEKVASTHAPVLIQGESGTGKELIADAIHKASPRRHRALVKINCSAIPADLVESELFGHEKGAYTGAGSSKIGLFEVADGGTVFLDEISEMQIGLQPKLLRILEGHPFRRVGGVKDIHVDARLMAATNRDLRAAVQEGTFRQDLFYRLGVMVIDVPPLRDRGEDVLVIAKAFLNELRVETRKAVSGWAPSVEELLVRYPWPGNVRELRNVLERALILSDSPVLLPEHLPPELRDSKGSRAGEVHAAPEEPSEPSESLEALERRYIAQILESTHGNRTEAAKRLGISRSTLKEKLRRLAPS